MSQFDAAPSDSDMWIARSLEIQDLFSPAAPINEASLIAGRRTQIQDLTDAIFERGRHAILYGERGVGKTSLASTFHMMFANRIKTISSIRKSAFPQDNFSNIWRRVFSEIQIDGVRVSEHYKGKITPDDVVRELGRFSLNTLPIIILDEFDKFPDVEGKKLMSHTIKALSDDRACNVTVVIVGVAEDIHLLIEEHASISRNIKEIKMPRMSDEEMNEILDQRYNKIGISIADVSRDQILHLSRGLPEYAHFLGRDAAVNALRNERMDVGPVDIDAAIRKMVQTSDQTLEESFNKAIQSNKRNNLYKQVLTACALAENDDFGRFTPSDVLEPLETILGRQIKIANFFPHIEAFCEASRGQILEKKGTSKAFKYRFRESKMQPYVIMKGVSNDLIVHNSLLGNR